MKSVKDLPVVQDGPPPGGFPSIRYARKIPDTGPTGTALFGVAALVMGYGFYRMINNNYKRRCVGCTLWDALCGMHMPQSWWCCVLQHLLVNRVQAVKSCEKHDARPISTGLITQRFAMHVLHWYLCCKQKKIASISRQWKHSVNMKQGL